MDKPDQAEFKARREAFLSSIDKGVGLFPAAPVYMRNNDVPHEYRQDSDFVYLTGFTEPESLLLLSNVHDQHRSVLFLRQNDPEKERWDGPRLGPDAAVEHFEVDAAFPISELSNKLPEYLKGAESIHTRLGVHAEYDSKITSIFSDLRAKSWRGTSFPVAIVDSAKTLHPMRMKKSPAEIARMKKAATISAEAHQNAMRVARPGSFEYEVEAELLRSFRANGAERTAYGSIVGAGVNATILHYRGNNSRLQSGDLLLVDAGCEWDFYASDITRTFPVNGEFTVEQRELYDIVLAAQKAAIEKVRPGNSLDVHNAAVQVISEGLCRLGLCQGDPAEVIESGAYKTFYMHRTSHWLGLDVHDVGVYETEKGPIPLEPGFVLTVEPGLYVSADAKVAEKWRGIGIRIEDDVLVTPEACEVLSEDAPKEPNALEQILKSRR
ncbi:MAG: aminopeptidase P N-terminal domain-containing protein [Myxococcales bacterium]|nr:MAG: aminopeptidase P N-terminal domain-containing protein [Myxococcales bacterium]